jgi:hypothetical protein
MHTLLVKCLLLFSLLALVAGCSTKSEVSGKVYYRGQPLTVGTVRFFPEGKGGDYSSPIGPDGSYKVSKLPPGPAKIAVLASTVNPTATMSPMAGKEWAAKGMKEAAKMMQQGKVEGEAPPPSLFETEKNNVSVPEKYTDPEKSGLTINVAGGKQTFDIRLE